MAASGRHAGYAAEARWQDCSSTRLGPRERDHSYGCPTESLLRHGGGLTIVPYLYAIWSITIRMWPSASPTARSYRSLTGHTPEPPRSTSGPGPEVLRGGSGWARGSVWCKVGGTGGQRLVGLRCQSGFGWVVETRETGKWTEPGPRLSHDSWEGERASRPELCTISWKFGLARTLDLPKAASGSHLGNVFWPHCQTLIQWVTLLLDRNQPCKQDHLGLERLKVCRYVGRCVSGSRHRPGGADHC
jgi:hypothetical protein